MEKEKAEREQRKAEKKAQKDKERAEAKAQKEKEKAEAKQQEVKSQADNASHPKKKTGVPVGYKRGAYNKDGSVRRKPGPKGKHQEVN